MDFEKNRNFSFVEKRRIRIFAGLNIENKLKILSK